MEIEKAYLVPALLERISNLYHLVQELEPKCVHGVGVNRTKEKNMFKPKPTYEINFNTYASGSDEDIIMRAGVDAMYETAVRLLELAKKELEDF